MRSFTAPSLLASLLAYAATAQAAPTATAMNADELQSYRPAPYVRVQTPEWARDAVLYELNLRQFTREGTLRAAQEQLPRIKALGADVVWLMPIHPIGEKNRKGPLGSPYAVRDYFAVNPAYGTLDDLKRFVERAHELGLRVILDWVANHTAWDNPLVTQHPEWYSTDWRGQFHPTSWNDWSDIIELDYDQPGLRRYMTEALKFWVREAGIDGYRCDVAGYVPLDFWNRVRAELDAIKPVFMLAEWQATDLHQDAFDATYAWDWYNAALDATTGGKGVGALRGFYSTHENAWPRSAMRMTFVSNHDKNSWDGTEFEQFGPGLEAATVLSVVGTGLPLIYNGQEAGNAKRLAFFDKDPIAWREHPRGELYRRLFELKKQTTALWNGQWGAPMQDVPNTAPADVLSFVRMDERGKVLAVFNFSPRPQSVSLTDGPYAGTYRDFATGREHDVDSGTKLALPPWGYRVLVR
jgi:1,4-alpha-glucan branching enzyme